MPPKRVRNAPPARQQMLFQATHKARSSARTASRHGKGKAHALAETSTPSPSLPNESDLVDLRSSSSAPKDVEGDLDNKVEEVAGPSSGSSRSGSPPPSRPHVSTANPLRLPRSATPVHPSDSSYFSEEFKLVDNLPELKINDPAFDEYWMLAKKKLGYNKVKPIHVEEENRVQMMLRVFDLDSAYGPSKGMSRLARWMRAHELGLNPPKAVRAMLETKQGQLELNKSVLERHLF